MDEVEIPTRPKHKCVEEILSYNGKLATPIRMMDLDILSDELGEDYEVRVWTFGKHLRTAVIKDGVSYEVSYS